MTRYQWFRRVAAPIAVVLALMLLVRTSCQQQEREPVSFRLDFGDASAEVRHVRVDLWDGDTSAGWFERDFDAAGATTTVTWKQSVSSPDLDVTIELGLADGTVVPIRHRIHVTPGGSSVIPAMR